MERETLETESLYHATNESYMYAAILTMATGLYPMTLPDPSPTPDPEHSSSFTIAVPGYLYPYPPSPTLTLLYL